MKNIKIIIVITSTLINIFGNAILGFASTALPTDSTPFTESEVALAQEGDMDVMDEALDNRGSVLTPPATLQYIVKFRSANAVDALAASNGVSQNMAQTTLSQISSKAARIDAVLSSQTFLVTFADQDQIAALLGHTTSSEPTKSTPATAASAHALEIEYMVPNLRRSAAFIPDDTFYKDQLPYYAPTGNSFGANVQSAWYLITGTEHIIIAVLDTGIRYEHPDLAGRLLPGYDFVSTAEMGNDGDERDADASDPGTWITTDESARQSSSLYGCNVTSSHWHGTHVAGIIGAQGNNQYGVAGANWVSKILPVRVLGKCGGYDSDIIDGIRWAAGIEVPGVPLNPTPAQIINLSLGSSSDCNEAYQDAINAVTAKGVIVVAAAGNQRGDANAFAPANCANVISVGSVSNAGNRASYSNAGSSVMISSPGGDGTAGVISTVDLGSTAPMSSGFKMLNGTSMAAAQVSGIVSLLKSAQPNLTFEGVRLILRNSVTAFPATSSCNINLCGAGIINAYAALQKLINFESVGPVETIKIQTLFLPMLASNASATMVNSFDSALYLENGGFEAGAQNWQMSSSIGLVNLILNRDQLPADRTPHSGMWMSWLGGMNDETTTISQQVVVPDAPVNLVYWKRVKSIETDCAHDTAQVLINNQPVQSILLCESTASTTWSSESVDLSAFAGQTVELKFQVSTDGADSSSLYLDNMAFQLK